ncbi:MAG: peptidoglycan DD-metalloendopeptidase family protein [Ruminococcus sp.]|jgi:murein DD-endopeptidase MepM/ murein hydrolase activator NlpD|nr:peptidoglycan DD-metalloendopeptidase family protein [Ruminococcus sp.]
MNRIKRILCALLSVCLISMPAALSATSVGAESIDSLQQQLQELEQKNQEYQDVLDKTQSDIDEKEKYNEALVSKIEVLDDKIALTRESISDLNNSIEEKQKDIDQANEDIDGQLDTLCERLRTIYMAGNASDIEIIFGAKDFSDFIDKVSLIQTLSSYDKELIEEINVKLEKISEQKTALEEDKSELEKQEASLEEDQSELNELLEENEETLRNLYTSNSNAKSALENAAIESEEIESQIKAYYQEQQEKAAQQSNNSSSSSSSSNNSSSNNSSSNSGSDSSSSQPSTPSVTPPTTSGYTWPCPGFYYLSSEWNEDRGSYNHGAIDIAGSGIMGAPVVAAESGTVIASYNGCPHNWGKNGSCGCGGGYGNYVFIDHGNGKMTVYGHFSNVIVSTGQTVTKGQTIGYVGSTGNSTGPHLHFECRYNGVKYNPMTEF